MTPTRHALSVLAAYVKVFAAPGFTIGAWHGGRPDARGVIEMPYIEYTETVLRFTADMSRLGLVRVFDWPTWAGTARGRELLLDPAAVAQATADELASLLTAVIRGERFCDGEIEAAFERGILQAAAARAAELLQR